MRKVLGILILIILPWVTSAQRNSAQDKRLYRAYKHKSLKQLNTFFIKWHKEFPPITDKELGKLSPLHKEAYAIFKDFYHPEVHNGSGNYDDYIKARYLLINNSIELYQSDSIIDTEDGKGAFDSLIKFGRIDTSAKSKMVKNINGKKEMTDFGRLMAMNFDYSRTESKDSITNFRPQVNCGSKIPVYLDEGYNNIIKSFLDHYLIINIVKGDTIMDEDNSWKDFFARAEFISNYIKTESAWGAYIYRSLPNVYAIRFNKTLDRAIISNTLSESGWESYMKKINNKWVLCGYRMTWIE